MRKVIRFLGIMIFLLLVLAGFIYASRNSTEVPLWIGVELAPQSIAVWTLLAFAWGGVIGLLFGFGLFRRIKAHYKIHQLEARIQKLEQGKSSFNPKTNKINSQD